MPERLGAGLDVVFHEAVEREDAVGAQGVVAVTVGTSPVLPVDHRELGTRLTERLFPGLSRDKVETPTVVAGLQHIHVERLESLVLRVDVRTAVNASSRGVVLEEAVEDDLVTVLVGVGPVEDEGRVGLEPPDVLGGAVPRHQREPTRQVTPEHVGVVPRRERLGIPEQRQVVQDRPVLREHHVVGQPGPRQGHVDVGDEFTGRAHDPVVHVRRLDAVVEEEQFAGVFVDARMSGDAFSRKEATPFRGALGLERVRIEAVQLTALVEAGQRLATVHDDVGRGVVLHHRASPPAAVGLGIGGVFGDTGPQRPARFLLGEEAFGSHETVGVRGFAVGEPDRMDHAVAVEGVVALGRFEDRRLGVAQVHTGEIVGDLTLDVEVPRVVFAVLGPPDAAAVGVIVVGRETAMDLVAQFDLHGSMLAHRYGDVTSAIMAQ